MNLEQAIKATDVAMNDAVGSDVPVLQDASRHILLAGGKRVRPRLLFLSYLIAGGTSLEDAVPLAAAVELVHTATLVHDDINDHGTTRRGHVTINERWGRTFALLTGDFLFAQVYRLMAPYKDLNTTFAEATVALVEGETLQAAAAKDNNLNRELYQKIVAKKTASLFRAAALLGAQLAGGKAEVVNALGEYGFYLGLAFQIVDDLLDLIGDPMLMGKDAGVDVLQGKGVASAVKANGSAEGYASSAVAVAEPPDDAITAIKRRMIEGGAVQEGRQMAQVLAMQANRCLDRLPQGYEVEQLRELITAVIERDN